MGGSEFTTLQEEFFERAECAVGQEKASNRTVMRKKIDSKLIIE